MEMDFKTWMTRLLKILVVLLFSYKTYAMTKANTLVLKFEAKHNLSAPVFINFSQETLKCFVLCLCDESIEKCTAVASNKNKKKLKVVSSNASTNKLFDKPHHRYRKSIFCKSQVSLNSTVWEFRFTCSNTKDQCSKERGGINLKAIWDTGSSLGNICLGCGLNIFWNDFIEVDTYNASLLNIKKKCPQNSDKSRNETGKKQEDYLDHMPTSPMISAANNSFCKNLFKTLENSLSTSSAIPKQAKSSTQMKDETLFESTTIQSAVTNEIAFTNQSVVTDQVLKLTTVNGNTYIDVPRTYENDTDGIKLNVAMQEHLHNKVENTGVGNYSASIEHTSSFNTLKIASIVTAVVTLCACISAIVFVSVRRKKKALQSARRYSLPRSQSLDETKKAMEV